MSSQPPSTRDRGTPDEPTVLYAHSRGFSHGQPNPIEEPSLPTIEQLIEVLLPLFPDAEVGLDNDGQVVIYTGLTATGIKTTADGIG